MSATGTCYVPRETVPCESCGAEFTRKKQHRPKTRCEECRHAAHTQARRDRREKARQAHAKRIVTRKPADARYREKLRKERVARDVEKARERRQGMRINSQSRGMQKPCIRCPRKFYGTPDIDVCPVCALASIPVYAAAHR